MRTLGALALLFAASCVAQQADDSAKVNDPENIERLNAVPGSTWVAGPQSFFEGLTYKDARVLLGTKLSHISKHLNETLADSVYASILDDDVPADFDSRTRWPGLIHPIRDQQRCGSCWAFSASEVLSDRVAIAQGTSSPVLSPEDLVSCDWMDMGCHGGNLHMAWRYLTHTGIVTDSCMPYTAGRGTAPRCTQTCADAESFTRTKAKTAYVINGVTNMRKDVMTNGPIQVAFMVYKSFLSYSSGVYHKHWYEVLPEGGHAVKILGWGVVNGTAYWTVANSWGTTWGEQGCFRIVRGKNNCGIEKMGPPFAGLPAVTVGEDLIVI